MPITLLQLRRFALARSLFTPTTLKRAIHKLGFVQADPIRAPARAQDLTLRHRVTDYRAGDLERRYAKLGVEEDFFVNYGFVPTSTHVLMHPRTPRSVWSKAEWTKARAVQSFVAEHGVVHLALEDVSIVASKLVEDARLASYTEKSTRYVAFDAAKMHTPLQNTLPALAPQLIPAFGQKVAD